jgi:hypothetical protein
MVLVLAERHTGVAAGAGSGDQQPVRVGLAGCGQVVGGGEGVGHVEDATGR